jgi:hypothetical protein
VQLPAACPPGAESPEQGTGDDAALDVLPVRGQLQAQIADEAMASEVLDDRGQQVVAHERRHGRRETEERARPERGASRAGHEGDEQPGRAQVDERVAELRDALPATLALHRSGN